MDEPMGMRSIFYRPAFIKLLLFHYKVLQIILILRQNNQSYHSISQIVQIY
jgi:hypothetical protein